MRLGLIFFLVLFVGCATPQIKPLDLAIDQEITTFPPSPEELLHHTRLIAEVLTTQGSTVTPARQLEILTFLHQSMESFGDFSYIPPMDVAAQLKTAPFVGFEPHSVVETLKLSASIGAEFASQVEIHITKSQLKQGIDQFSADIQLALFKVSTGQLIFKEKVVYSSANPLRSKKRFKKSIQSSFPLKGFIIETRGGREVAKITLGASFGLQIGRKVLIRSRKIRHQLVRGIDQTQISYSTEALAKGEVIQVSTNDAWIWIPEAKRSQFRTGDLVFTLPETSHSIF